MFDNSVSNLRFRETLRQKILILYFNNIIIYLGLIMRLLSMAFPKLAYFHLLTHALFKAL